MGAHERIRIVQLRASEQIKTALIDQHAGAVLLDHQVILGRWGFVEIKLILEAAAAAGQDGDAEGRGA